MNHSRMRCLYPVLLATALGCGGPSVRRSLADSSDAPGGTGGTQVDDPDDDGAGGSGPMGGAPVVPPPTPATGGRGGVPVATGGTGGTPEVVVAAPMEEIDDPLGLMYRLVDADFSQSGSGDGFLLKRWNGQGSIAQQDGLLVVQSGLSGDFGSPNDQGPCALAYVDQSFGERFEIDIRFRAEPGAQAITMRLQADEPTSYKYMLLVQAGELQTMYWQGQPALNTLGRGRFSLSGASGEGIHVRIRHDGWKIQWLASRDAGQSYEAFDSLNLFGDHRWVGLCDSNTTRGPTVYHSIEVRKLD